MEARVVDLRILPTEAREVVRIYRDSVLPAARRQQGIKGALLLTDDETGVGISISLWETEEDRGKERQTASTSSRSGSSRIS